MCCIMCAVFVYITFSFYCFDKTSDTRINISAHCFYLSRAGGLSAVYSAIFETITPSITDGHLDIGTAVSSTEPSLKDMIVKALSKKASLLDLNSLNFDTGKCIYL